MIDYPRPELRQTIIFGETPEFDEHPIISPKGRLIAGPEFSQHELERLNYLASSEKSDTGLITPTQKQLSRIALNQTTGCWELPVYDDPKPRARYGQLSVKGIENPSNLAHRTMYMVFYGADSLPGKRHDYLDHLCENKPCCYPRHLEVVTHAINTIRGQARHAEGQLTIDFKS